MSTHTSIGQLVAYKLQKIESRQAQLVEKFIHKALFFGGFGILDPRAVTENGPNTVQFPE